MYVIPNKGQFIVSNRYIKRFPLKEKEYSKSKKNAPV